MIEKYVGSRPGLRAAHSLGLWAGVGGGGGGVVWSGDQAVKQTIIIHLMGQCASIKRQALDGSTEKGQPEEKTSA